MKHRILKNFSEFTQRWPLPTEGKKYIFLLTFLLLISFFFSALYFFPVNSLKGRVETDLARNLKADIAIGNLAMVFPLNFEAKNVRATLPTPTPYILKIDSLLLRPVWNAFLSGKSAYTFSARLYQGSAEGEVDDEGQFIFNLRNMLFSFPLNEKVSLMVGGVAREAHLSGKYPPATKDEMVLDLDIEKLELSGTKSFGLGQDLLPLGQLRLQGKGQGRTFRIEQLNVSGGAIEGDGKGTVVLRTPVERSTLRLNAVLRTDAGNKEIGDLLSLIKKPAPDGSYQIRLQGTLGRPVLR